jgi:hypothetical protein
MSVHEGLYLVQWRQKYTITLSIRYDCGKKQSIMVKHKRLCLPAIGYLLQYTMSV